MKKIKLHSVRYSPGYGDMLGGYHEVSLKKDKNGNWTYVCSDREVHYEPTVTTIYAVSAEAVAQFEEFIIRKKVFSLENRPKSNLFVTDYSPWSWYIDYETTSFEKAKLDYCSIGEFKQYSRRDCDLLKELCERFTALRGEKISEVTEESHNR